MSQFVSMREHAQQRLERVKVYHRDSVRHAAVWRNLTPKLLQQYTEHKLVLEQQQQDVSTDPLLLELEHKIAFFTGDILAIDLQGKLSYAQACAVNTAICCVQHYVYVCMHTGHMD